MVSIIIPCYNEENVIGRALTHLLDGADAANLEILVCCNGCHDRTAEIARAFGPPVHVLETTRGSKTLALNMGDTAATSFPRIYLDADVVLNYAAVKSIVRALENKNVLAVAPRMRVDYTNRNWLIRSFYETWLKMPYHLKGMIGTGIYALSEEGRRRFSSFPEIIADDGFVYALFAPHERQTLEDCSFTIVPPKDVSSLVRIKTRSKLGSNELALTHPELVERQMSQEDPSCRRIVYRNLLMRPWLWPKLAVFTTIKFLAAARAREQMKTLKDYQWERDESSR